MRFRRFLVLSAALAALLPGGASAAGPQASDEEPWWLAEPVRLIQTNLREIDALDFDVEVYVAKAKEFGANTMLINVGGIVANYPTELEFHYRNPNLKFDMIGEVVKRLHEEDIRVIGRFDFSKINETLAAKRPEWLYRSLKGETVNYNGQVHACLNGGYEQEYLFEILGEVVDKYPLDAIFFNMPGYQTADYSRNYHGICQSDACRRRFRDWSGGLDLPRKEDPDDPVFLKYDEFRRETSEELFVRVNEFIKSKRKDMAICTYKVLGVDLIRSESASFMNNVRPPWEFHSTDNVKRALGSYKNKQVANAAVHFPDYAYRHSSVAPYLTGMRLIENFLNGGSLDYYVIGRLDNQEDRAVLRNVKDVFQFHKRNERWFTGIRPRSDVCLIRGEGISADSYRGMIRILAENHVLFDTIESWVLDTMETPKPLEDYKLLILPNVSYLSDATCKRLDNYVAAGGKILATGHTSTRDEIGNPRNRFRLKAAGVNPEYHLHERKRGNYLRIFPGDKETLKTPSFEDLDIVYLRSDLLEYKLEAGAKGFLGLIPEAMFGPPEKCYYTKVTDIPALIQNDFGEGRFAYFPWAVAEHYQYRSHHGHGMLVMSAIHDLLGYRQDLELKAPPLVEVTRHEDKSGSFEWIGLANHSGQIGTATHAPLPIRGVNLRFRPAKKARAVRLLRSGAELKLSADSQGWLTATVPELNEFEVVLVEYD